ncbi:hypothetical protein [Thiomicrospira pelophila]|uniref:hypothetical protein n=1 Tax=Thiomicrospira pelophila TaxID=934 RepID=UPI000A58F2CC|nr:hypothetical protein [Thiomicrospira pelophila]
MFKFISLVFVIYTFLMISPQASSLVLSSDLSASDRAWIGEKIFQNETAGKVENLTFWSPNEEFPSFGIGHFIWIPKHVEVPFESTFVEMVAFVSQSVSAPKWIQQRHAPWVDKAEFDQAWWSEDMQTLREWLVKTKPQQTAFIMQRFEARMARLLSDLPKEQSVKIRAKVQTLSQTRAGYFALIDYANFKGFGDHPAERYQNQGWGLLQVLQIMPSTSNPKLALQDYAQAAETVLRQRVKNAPIERNEQRWMPGWAKRVAKYAVE